MKFHTDIERVTKVNRLTVTLFCFLSVSRLAVHKEGEGDFTRGGFWFEGGLLAGVAVTGEIHLKRQCASEGILKGVSPKGEFHETSQSASEALLAGVASTGEIHLVKRCASEGPVEGVRL